MNKISNKEQKDSGISSLGGPGQTRRGRWLSSRGVIQGPAPARCHPSCFGPVVCGLSRVMSFVSYFKVFPGKKATKELSLLNVGQEEEGRTVVAAHKMDRWACWLNTH